MMEECRSMRRKRGFTLVELMVTLAILSFGILGVAAIQLNALSRGNESRFSFGAAQVAKSQLAQIQRLPWSALPQTGNNGNTFEALCVTTGAGGACNSPGPGLPTGTSGYPRALPDSLPTVIFDEVLADGTIVEPIQYDVAWRVKNVAISGSSTSQCRKEIYLRVQWQEKNFPTREFYLSTRIFNALGDRGASESDLGIPSASLVGGC